jgi:hypothetical protein
MAASASSSSAPWRSGLEGARAHFWPGVAVQVACFGLVLAYYRCPPAREALTHLMKLRLAMGFAFAILSTGLFGGFLPFCYLHFAKGRGGPARYRWPQGLALTAFWAYKGFEVDLFYRILARTVGPGHGAATIASKVVIDQFIYCPVVAIPLTVAIYQWTEANFDGAAVLSDWRTPGWYVRRVLPVLISNLGVWIPAAAIIYALPTPLQLPLQNLVLCFFTLLIAHQTRTQAVEPATRLDCPL